MQKITTVFFVLAFTLTGCQAVKGTLAKRDNGSLDYTNAKKLNPIRLPAHQQTVPFVPLYDVPAITGRPNTPTNDAGTQYQLPAPPKVVVR